MTSNTLFLEELPYRSDSCGWFERLRDLPRPLLLDSCYPHSRQGRFDILLADPAEDLSFTCSDSTTYDDILRYFKSLEAAVGEAAQADTLPFCGGLAGYLDYELGLPLQYLPAIAGASAHVHRYNWALVQDHRLGRCHFVCQRELPESRRRDLLARLREPYGKAGQGPAYEMSSRFDSNLDLGAYEHAFRQIQQYIHAGDCYQVNLARRFAGHGRGDPWAAYQHLRPLAAAPFSAYMDTGSAQLLCLSPERFLRVAGRHVETRPIKGTRPRSSDPRTDALSAEELSKSSKDRAENLMIVDLLRNDIGRVCRPGSIEVDGLFELESYPSVHHLVSTISGELVEGATPLDLLRNCFPGGSITGAPKRRAMEIIGELEPHSRRAYCGSVFYLSACGRMDSNIAIRSLLSEGDDMFCWGGGGLVADSQWEKEYQETWDKVGRFIEALDHR